MNKIIDRSKLDRKAEKAEVDAAWSTMQAAAARNIFYPLFASGATLAWREARGDIALRPGSSHIAFSARGVEQCNDAEVRALTGNFAVFECFAPCGTLLATESIMREVSEAAKVSLEKLLNTVFSTYYQPRGLFGEQA